MKTHCFSALLNLQLNSDNQKRMDEWLDLAFDMSQQSTAMQLNQTSSNNSQCVSFTYNQNVFPALTFLMFPLALFLNGMAAWVSLHLKSTSTFVVYLKNLVAADLILTLLIPLKAASDLRDAPKTLFKLSCRFFSTTFYSTQYTCITLLGFISLDRFFKIMAPRNKLLSLKFSKVTSGFVWLILFGGTALPNIILTNKSAANTTDISSCMILKGPDGIQLHGIIVISLNVLFWVISVIIAVCYICIANKVFYSIRKSGSNNNQGKQKIKLRVFLVVFVFFVSFTPYHIVRIPYTFQQVSYSSMTSCSYLMAKFAKEFSLWLATANTCMDPLLYVFLCREFKEKLTSMTKNVLTTFKVAAAGKAEATSSKNRL
ncbi:P2Y purinoceptor 13-like [Anabas testudineus]|uniref:P2Y purinoceptor 13-like n=1 Tax=Anabas testudineus TaxID=64144 RepID=UPI000E459BFE|nr:P2Y purinoceptor 13-like [Anabas testudineus]